MDKYGLIGYPLGHSFSISYFNEKFQNEGIDAKYINFEIFTFFTLHIFQFCQLNLKKTKKTSQTVGPISYIL